MCNCINVMAQTYENQVVLDAPVFMLPLKNCIGDIKKPYICVDKCLEREIKELWNLKIKTIGCCCGHNYLAPYIQVSDDCIEKMKQIGYIHQKDGIFKPKSV